jgi:hypothetical protein
VWEGHYVYPGTDLRFIPTFAGGMFEGLMAVHHLCHRGRPGIYSPDGGFYDAVNPTTGSVGHRRLVLDQSMIMAALDDALNDGGLQRYFARDPTSWAARLYLSTERMSLR